MNFNAIEGRVLRYLERRFVAGGGFGSAMPDEIMKENGLQPDQYTRLIARFESLGILEEVTLDGLISIKGAACNYVADLDHDRSTPPPPTVNIMNIGQVSHSQIQQGTVGSTQTTVESVARQARQRRDSDRSVVLLTVATDAERDAVLSVAFDGKAVIPAQRFYGDHTYFDLGTHGGCDILLVKTGMGAGGAMGSLVTIHDSIHALSPSAIVMVGIAFGIDQERQKIGDVLVSRQVLCYECQRVTETTPGAVTISPRGDRVSASPRLLDRFDAGSVGWKVATVHLGLILSGDKLVDSPSFKRQLLSFEPEAIGGEMEAAGLYASAYKGKIDWIMVKGICDWGENKNNPNKKQDQALAATNATAFVFHVIRQGGFHCDGDSVIGSLV